MRSEYIAQVLYASKGTVSDNENNATRAILAIQANLEGLKSKYNYTV